MSVLGSTCPSRRRRTHNAFRDAKNLVEERYKQLEFPGRQISKEKLLTFLALGLADDLLQSDQGLTKVEARLERLLTKIDGL